jgi:uncharacterized protein (TIGR02147 family)
MNIELKKIAHDLSPTNYLKCSQFLEDLYSKVKKAHKSYSYLQFAADLGFSATNAIRLVIVGKRRLSRRSALTIAKTLGMSNQHKKYFVLMAEYQLRSLTSSKSNFLLKSLEQKNASIGQTTQASLMRYFSSWLHPIVREACKANDFRGTVEWFNRNFFFKINSSLIQESIKLLGKIGYITHSEDYLKASIINESIQTFLKDSTAEYLSFQRYHEECLELAKEALHKVPAEQRDFNVLTLTLSNENYEVLQSRIKELCQWALSLDESSVSRMASNEKSTNNVCQLSTQIFCLSKPDKPKNGGKKKP